MRTCGTPAGSWRAAQTLDLSRSTAIMLIAVLHFILDEDDHWNARQEVARLFAGLEMLGPGLVTLSRWRPDRPSRYAQAGTFVHRDRQRALALPAGLPHGERAACLRARRRLGGERGLAHASLAGEEKDRARICNGGADG